LAWVNRDKLVKKDFGTWIKRSRCFGRGGEKKVRSTRLEVRKKRIENREKKYEVGGTRLEVNTYLQKFQSALICGKKGIWGFEKRAKNQ
jgi:hypothetical protein